MSLTGSTSGVFLKVGSAVLDGFSLVSRLRNPWLKDPTSLTYGPAPRSANTRRN